MSKGSGSIATSMGCWPMSADAAHHSSWEIGEVVFGIPFLLSLVIHFLIPLPFAHGLLRLALVPVGTAFIITGIGLIVLARREFANFHQPTDPGRPTNKVVKTGVFSVSRNPLYLGAAIFLLGISLAFNSLWALAALLLSMILCHYVLIFPEERYLAAKFGDEYKDYAATVRRWLGRK